MFGGNPPFRNHRDEPAGPDGLPCPGMQDGPGLIEDPSRFDHDEGWKVISGSSPGGTPERGGDAGSGGDGGGDRNADGDDSAGGADRRGTEKEAAGQGGRGGDVHAHTSRNDIGRGHNSRPGTFPNLNRVSWGKTYILSIPDAKEQSFRIFDELLKSQVKGLCISNELPKRIFERYDTFVMKVLNNDPTIVMLNEDKMEHVKCVHPMDTDGLINEIRDFTTRRRNSVLLLDGLSSILLYNPLSPSKVGQFLLYIRKLMEENDNIGLIPVHQDVLNQKLFTEIRPLLMGALNLKFVDSGDLELDQERIIIVENTLCESRLDIHRDNTTDMWHELRGIVQLGRMPSKEFFILSDKRPIQDLRVRVLDGFTGRPLEFDHEDFEEHTMKLDIHFPRPLEKGDEYRLIIEYLTTAFQAVGEDFYLHSVVHPIGEIKTFIRFPPGVTVEGIEGSDYQLAGDLKRPLSKYPSPNHNLDISADRREIHHTLKNSPERCMFRIIWRTADDTSAMWA